MGENAGFSGMIEQDRPVPNWLDVSRETLDRLIELERLVLKWTSAVNLISKGSATNIWSRHILDSAQIAGLANWGHGTWADLGSGGGFPGLVLAVLAKEHSPAADYTLVESDARKAAFLLQAVRMLDLRATVLVQRIEVVPPLSAEALSARALGSLDVLLGLAVRHLAAGGRAYFPKGASYGNELDSARQRWRFQCHTHISQTDPQSAILEVEGIELL
jgi:16S rRNA (guanine527-N7)-methyltransferase